MRRLRLPAALTVTVVGVAATFSACSGDDGPPDARITADARAPGDGSAVPDGGSPTPVVRTPRRMRLCLSTPRPTHRIS